MSRKGLNDIGFFFNPHSIAVIGASNIPTKPSNIIIKSLKRVGFSGHIYPVNPKHKYIEGIRCYGSVKEIQDNIDIAVIAVPAPIVPDVLMDADRRLRGIIIISSGFKEIGNKGRKLEEKLREIASERNVRIIGPNCLGIYDSVSRLDTFFLPAERIARPDNGCLSILTQSGSFAAMIMDELSTEGIGVARFVSYGNTIDVNESDCLEFLIDDSATKFIALYIESIEDGRRFVDIASRCAKVKPVFAVKVGKKRAGGHAAMSHTGAMAGRYDVYRAAFKKAGVVELEGYEGLRDACKILSAYYPIEGNKVLIITNGGGIGVNIADACEKHGLDIKEIDKKTEKGLISNLPSFCSIGNPIDLTGSVTDRDYITAIKYGLKGEYDVIIVALMWGPPGLTEGLVPRLINIMGQHKKPIVICTPGGSFSRGIIRMFKERGVPIFPTPEAAARAAWVLAGNVSKIK